MRALPSVLAATALTVAAGLSPAPASAAGCPDGSGVTVVVDPGPLGGQVVEECVPDGGGRTAAEIVDQAGLELTYVQGQPFVCRVDGRPDRTREGCGRTPPTDAYWGLFWAEDAGSTWSYATLGVSALTVPDGGAVGWRWQDGGAREEPPAPSPSGAADPAPDRDQSAVDEPTAGSGDSSLPGWAAAGAVLVLAGAAGAVAWRRRS